MSSPSPTSSISSGYNSTIGIRNGPQQSEYIKPHKNISLSFAEGTGTFQQGDLGDSDTFLVGTIHLNYQRSCQVKSIHLHLKGTEKTSWQKSQARSKYVYGGEHTLVDQTNKIWEAFEEVEEITLLDIPFKIQLPYNLPDTVTTEIGSVQYVLKATVNTKSLIGTGQQTAKISCPLRRTIVLEVQSSPPYKLSGETPGGIDYTFILPPNKSFNLGTYVSIPMKLRFLKPNVGIEKLEICLRTSMDFQSTTQGESRHVDRQIMGIVVPRSELRYVQPLTQNQESHGECTYTVNLFVPKNVQPTYQGRFIGISHFLSIKFCLWGFETDFHVEESVRIAHIFEKQPINHGNQVGLNHSNSIGSNYSFGLDYSSSIGGNSIMLNHNNSNYNNSIGGNSIGGSSIGSSSTITHNNSNSLNHSIPINAYSKKTQTLPTVPTSPPTPPPSLPPRLTQTPSPIHAQYPYTSDHSIENTYYQQHFQALDHMARKKPTQMSEHSRNLYDRPYDGYSVQQPLSLNYNQYNNNNNVHYQSESSGSPSRTSTPSRSEDLETSSITSGINASMINDIVYYPTNLSPPPYRQVTRQTEVISNNETRD